MRRLASRISLLLLCGVAAAAHAALQPDAASAATPVSVALTEVMSLLAARRHDEVSFIEQQFLSVLKKPTESSGELVYDAPDRLEKRTLEPRLESLVLVGNVLTVQRGKRSHVLELNSYPQLFPLVDSIRATLAGDRDALERVFRLEFTGTVARWTLLLVPLDVQVLKSITKIQIDGMRDHLIKIEIRSADGDHSLMTLRSHPLS